MTAKNSTSADDTSFADLRASFSDNAEAVAILDAAEREGKTPGAAAFAIITSGCLSQTEEQDRQIFAADASIQREFISAENYVAWRRGARRAARAGRSSAATFQRGRPAAADADMARYGTEAEASGAFRSSPALQAEYFAEANFLAVWRHATGRRRTH